MIVTNKFVFIHLHKTGGQTIGRVISEACPDAKEIGYHYPRYLLPKEFETLPVVGMVRNPWDWYISWYAFNIRPNISNPLFFILSNGQQAGFKTTIMNLINLGSDTAESKNYRRALIEVFPETLENNQGVGLSKQCFRSLEGVDAGYYSWQFNRMYGDVDDELTHIGRFESLETDFLSIMDSCFVSDVNEMRQIFDRSERINRSSHEHYSRYFDDDLRALVAKKEKKLIEKFGYEFEVSGLSQPICNLPRKQIEDAKDDFQKLDGKFPNFRLIHPGFGISAIKEKLARLPKKTWLLSGREKRYKAHTNTQTILLIHDKPFRHYQPTYCAHFKKFQKVVTPIFDFISEFYQHDGFIGRALFAKLPPGKSISPHTDGIYSLVKCNRVHIPLMTNEKVKFMIGGEEKVLVTGEVWEINNATLHAVDNRGDTDRIHLIVDWIPNSTVRPQDKIISEVMP